MQSHTEDLPYVKQLFIKEIRKLSLICFLQRKIKSKLLDIANEQMFFNNARINNFVSEKPYLSGS